MLQLIAGVAAVLVVALSTFTVMHSTEKAIDINKQAKNILAIDKKREIPAKVSGQVIKNSSDIPNLKLSSLAIMPSTKDKILLDKLQNAMKIAVVTNKIESPSCSDLASTGKITLTECNEIAFKEQNYVKIDNSIVQMPKTATAQKIAKSIKTITNSSINDNETNLLLSNPKTKAKEVKADFAKAVKTAEENKKIVKLSDSVELDNFLLEKVIQNSIKAPVKSLDVAQEIRKKMQAKIARSQNEQNNVREDEIEVTEDVSNAIGKLKEYVSLVHTAVNSTTPITNSATKTENITIDNNESENMLNNRPILSLSNAGQNEFNEVKNMLKEKEDEILTFVLHNKFKF